MVLLQATIQIKHLQKKKNQQTYSLIFSKALVYAVFRSWTKLENEYLNVYLETWF